MPPALTFLTLSRNFSLLFIASGRSSGLHPVSSHSCYMYVRAGRPVFAWPYVGVHRSTSLMSSSLLLQRCPAYLVRLTFIVFVMGGKWPYSWCLVGCRRQDLFNIVLGVILFAIYEACINHYISLVCGIIDITSICNDSVSFWNKYFRILHRLNFFLLLSIPFCFFSISVTNCFKHYTENN